MENHNASLYHAIFTKCYDLVYVLLDQNLFSLSFGQIVLTVAEHHSAIVPWQFVSQKTGATLKYVGLTKEGVPDIEQLKGFLSNKTKIVVVHHVSNVLGKLMFHLNEICHDNHTGSCSICQKMSIYFSDGRIAIQIAQLNLHMIIYSLFRVQSV